MTQPARVESEFDNKHSHSNPDSRSKATQATPTIFQVVGRHCAPRLAHSKTDLRADALMQLKQGLWHNLTS